VNIADAVITGFVGWLLAKAFKHADALPAAPSKETPPAPPPVVVPHAPAQTPTTIPWPRGDTSIAPPKKAAQALTPAERGAAPDGTSLALPHVLVPTGAPYGSATRKQYFKTGPARAAPQTEAAAVATRERLPYDRTYWRPKRKVPAPVAVRAHELLAQWQPGGVVFDGPRTFAGRVQFRMTKHSGKRAVEAWEPAPPFVA